ncbi:MAG: AI-2E family transporter [Desulfobacterales bacterium]|nr:AI-2E family transporter [Desulfobacterales bacterium]
MEKKYPPNMILWFFLACFLISIFLMGWLLRPFVSILILAAVVAGLFSPVYKAIHVQDKINKPFASLFTCIIIFLILFVPIVFFVSMLSKEAYGMYLAAKSAVYTEHLRDVLVSTKALEHVNHVLSYLQVEITSAQLNTAVTDIGKEVGLFLYEQANAIVTNVLSFFVNFFFMLLIIYYLLIDGERFIIFITDLSPLPKAQDEKLIQKFKDMAGAVLIGNGLCGILQGVFGGFLFMFFGLNSPFLWGVIMSLLAFLPIVGIGAVLVPAAIILFVKGRIIAALFFLCFYVILSGSVEYILKPKLVGTRVKMHTLLVFLSIIGGLKLFGILGIIYGPLVVTSFLTMTDIYHSSYRTQIALGDDETD